MIFKKAKLLKPCKLCGKYIYTSIDENGNETPFCPEKHISHYDECIILRKLSSKDHKLKKCKYCGILTYLQMNTQGKVVSFTALTNSPHVEICTAPLNIKKLTKISYLSSIKCRKLIDCYDEKIKVI